MKSSKTPNSHFPWKPKISMQKYQLLLFKSVQIVQMFVVFCGDKSKRLILTSQVTDNSLKSWHTLCSSSPSMHNGKILQSFVYLYFINIFYSTSCLNSLTTQYFEKVLTLFLCIYCLQNLKILFYMKWWIWWFVWWLF